MDTPHDESDPIACDIIWSHFSYNIPEIELEEEVFNDPDGELFAALQGLRNAVVSQREYGAAMTESCLAVVIVTAARLQKENAPQSSGIDWQRVLDHIDESIPGQMDFSVLAEQDHYSYDRFRHLFKERFEMSCYAYLTRQRIERAKRLLRNSDSHLTNIAYDCGFSSSSQFSNIFKKYTGVTPTEYRRS